MRYEIETNTKFFIDNFLSPVGGYDHENENLYSYYSLLNSFVDWYHIRLYIKFIPYLDFLNTLYWKFIIQEKKMHNYDCEGCGNPEYLQVHHLNYEHHGEELQHLGSLQVLCKMCHKITHNPTKYPFKFPLID